MHFYNPLINGNEFEENHVWQRSYLWHLAENYLHVGQKAYEITLIIGKTVIVQESNRSSDLLLTVLKVISYVTIVLPIAALIINAVYRKDYFFEILKRDPSNSDIDVFTRSYELFVKKATNESIEKLGALDQNSKEFNLVQAVKELDAQLSTLSSYLDGQEKILATVYVVLQKLLRGPEQDDLDRAQKVFKKISAFLRKHADSKWESNYDSYLNNDGLFHLNTELRPSGYLQNAENLPPKVLENHVILIFLLKKLRKFIRLNTKEAKRLEKLQEHEIVKNIPSDLFNRALKYLSLTWLHGTKAVVIKSACENTNRELLPAGELQKRNLQMMSGELGPGAAGGGVNCRCISSVGLGHAMTCRNYAFAYFFFDIDKEIECLEGLMGLMGLKCGNYQDLMDRGNFSRIVEALRRVQRLRPEKFEEKKEALEKKLQEIKEAVKVRVFDLKPDGIFNHSDDIQARDFYALLKSLAAFEDLLKHPLKVAQITEEDEELAKIGIVFGSTTKFGFPESLSVTKEPDEELYEGSLRLGEDIQVIFAEEANIPKLKQVVKDFGLEDSLTVEPMIVLETACKMERALGPYFYDVYSIRKWEAVS